MINLNDTELYFLMSILLCCSIGTSVYCICCKKNYRLQYNETM